MYAEDVWFQSVSLGLTEREAWEWTFSTALLVYAMGKTEEFGYFGPTLKETRCNWLPSERSLRQSRKSPICYGQFMPHIACIKDVHLSPTVFTVHEADLIFTLWYVSLSWLDDMLGDTFLNCFDRCAVNVTIKIMSVLKYTSGSQLVKYRWSVQGICCAVHCEFDTDYYVVFPLSVTVPSGEWHVLGFVYQAANNSLSRGAASSHTST